MASITITVVRAGSQVETQTSTPSDAELDEVVAAYQNDANNSLGFTATYAQVLNYVIGIWFAQTRARVQQFNTIPPVVPSPVNLN